MGFHDITEDGAELLAALLEAVLYGFSLLMFVATMWMLISQRSPGQVNRKMFAVACVLLFFSSAHLVINMIRIAEGFVLYRDAYPNGSIGYFSNLSQWTWVWRSYVYTVQTLTGDGVVLYRCYVVWQSKLIMILPALLWCSVVVTGFVCPYMLSQAAGHAIYSGSIWKWIIAFYASTLTTNLFTTSLLVYRIWSIDKATSRGGRRRSRLRPVLQVILDAGVIYSLSLIVALICFSTQSNGQFVILNMITPIISITFYMVIIRVGIANRADQSTNATPHSWPLSPSARTPNQSRGMQVHVTTSTEAKYDGHHFHQYLPPSVTSVGTSQDASTFGYAV